MPENPSFLKWALLLVSSLTIMSIITISPSLPEMATTFADVPNAEFWVKLVLTTPALCIAISSFFVGSLIDRYGRLPLLWIALLLYAAAGTAGFYLGNLFYILLSRLLLGIAVGISMTIVTTLVADYFEGAARQQFVGIQVAFMSIGGIVFISLAGLLADIDWRYPFLIYGFSVLVLPIALRFLYEPERDQSTGSLLGVTVQSPKLIWLVFGNVLCMWILFFLIPVQLPFHLKAIGVSSNALIGGAISVSTAFSALSSFFYARIKNRFSFPALFAIGYTFMAFAFALIAYGQSYGTTLIAMMIAGLGMGLMIPNTSMWVMQLAPPKIRGREIGRMTTFWFLGQFLSPLLLLPISNQISVTNTFYLAAASLLVLAIGFLVLSMRRK